MILLRRGTLYGPEPLGTGDVLLGGGRILALGELAPPPTDWPVEVVELDGAPVIPGLVDVHAHLSGGGGEGGAHTRVPPVGLTQFTTAGVTTVVGLLGTDATTRTPAELLASARALSHHGLTAYCYTGSYEVPPPTITGSVRGDLVHVDRMIAVGELAISDHRSSQPTFDELARIAADAHVSGLMTGKAGLVHLHLGDGERGLSLVRELLARTELPPRVLHPTHLNRNPRLWAEALRLAAEVPLYCDVTAFPEDDEDMAASEAVWQWLEHGLDPGRITVSSDGGGCLPTFSSDGVLERMDVGSPEGLLRTVRELVARGVPLQTALLPVTANPATLFRFHGKGRLAAGLDADVVVLDGDGQARHVLAGGRFLVREGEPTQRGIFE